MLHGAEDWARVAITRGTFVVYGVLTERSQAFWMIDISMSLRRMSKDKG